MEIGDSARSPFNVTLATLRLLLASGLVAGMLCVSSTVEAQDLRVQPDPLVISGRIDQDDDSFTRVLRLTAVNGDIFDLSPLSRGLTLENDSTVIIRASDVEIESGISLNRGRPHQVQVTIENVPRPGVYRGTIEFPLPGDSTGPTTQVGVVAEIGEVPVVVPFHETRTIQVVPCNLKVTCWLSSLLVPGRVQSSVALSLENETRVAASIESIHVDLLGTHTGQRLGQELFAFSHPDPVPPERISDLVVSLNPDRIQPDAYQGSLRIRVEDASSPTVLGLTLNVRAGLWGAVLSLVLGILIGHMRERLKKSGDESETNGPSLDPEAHRYMSVTKFLGYVNGKPPKGGRGADILKGVIFVILLFALAALGMDTLYGGNLSFGSGGLNDYLGLFIWGFGADVAQLELND